MLFWESLETVGKGTVSFTGCEAMYVWNQLLPSRKNLPEWSQPKEQQPGNEEKVLLTSHEPSDVAVEDLTYV